MCIRDSYYIFTIKEIARRDVARETCVNFFKDHIRVSSHHGSFGDLLCGCLIRCKWAGRGFKKNYSDNSLGVKIS